MPKERLTVRQLAKKFWGDEETNPSYRAPKPEAETLEEQIREFYQLHHDPNAALDPKVQEDLLACFHKDLRLVRDKWEASPRRQALIALVEEKILPAEDLAITRALCLGLGSFEGVWGKDYYGTWAANGQGEFWANNFSFFQLLLFETVIDTLRKRFDIKGVAFQDPEFTAADRTFLEERGHTTYPYPASEMAKASFEHGYPLDPNIMQQYSSNTFLFTPFLDKKAIVPAVQALRPNLYLGTELVGLLADANLKAPEAPTATLMQDFEAFAWSRDFAAVMALSPQSDAGQGFHWPRDSEDESVVEKARERLQRSERKLGRYNLAKQRELESEAGKAADEAKRREISRWEEKYHAVWRERAGKEEKERAEEGGGKEVA